MNKEKLLDIQSWVRSELDKSVRFWLDHGMDHEHGGVYTCLDRKGEIYSTDKSVWMQGRCGWIFAFLCHHYGVRQEWLDASKSCLDFMERYCINREAGDRMYFTVTAEGKPLRQRRYYYSEAFYALANAEYYGVTGDKECLERARKAFVLRGVCGVGMSLPSPELPEKLRQSAQLRLENPEATLQELADMQTPPVSKSAINHRMRKLVQLAAQQTT